MKNLARLSFAFVQVFLVTIAIADNSQSQSGRIFQKRIENNYKNNVIVELSNGKTDGMYNYDSKSAIEKLFFGDFNAPAEYFYSPSSEASPEGPLGGRLYRDSMGRWVLETKRFANFREVEAELDREFPYRSILYGENLSKTEEAEIQRQNREMMGRRGEERLKRYRVASCVVSLSDSLSSRLYERLTRAIDSYKSPGKLALFFDGDWVTFRTVVGYDLWSINIQAPEGELETLSDLFRAMIADVEAGQFDEAKYLERLR